MKKMKMALIALAIGLTSAAAYAGSSKTDALDCSDTPINHTPSWEKNKCDDTPTVICCYELFSPYEAVEGNRIP